MQLSRKESVCVCWGSDLGAVVLQVVWPREGLQRPSHGPAGAQSGGPLQLLLPQVHHENCSNARRSGKRPPNASGVGRWRNVILAGWCQSTDLKSLCVLLCLRR